MKYILKNIKLFYTEEKFLFGLTFLTAFVSVLMLHFSYGLYQSYMLEKELVSVDQTYLSVQMNYELEKYNQDDETGGYRLKSNKTKQYITLAQFYRLVKELSKSFQEDLVSVDLRAEVDNYPLEFGFNIEDNKIVRSDYVMSNMKKNGILTEGRYFTKKEYDDGMDSAIIFDQKWNAGNTPFTDNMKIDDDHILLNGKKYKIIGKQSIYADLPMIPITSLKEDTIIFDFISFEFGHGVNSEEYNELKQAVEENFGELASLETLNLPDNDKVYLYNTIIIVSVFIALISGINFAILYRYILQSREKSLRILRICGMTKQKGIIYFITECILLVTPAYLSAVLVFAGIFLPKAGSWFYYMQKSYPMTVYGALFGIYYGTSIIILLCMTLSQKTGGRA
jgi:hypothetical protein